MRIDGNIFKEGKNVKNNKGREGIGFKEEDKFKMKKIEQIIRLDQGIEVETYINAFGNMFIEPIDESLIAPRLYLRKFQDTIILAEIELQISNKGTATKIIKELIEIVKNNNDLKNIEIENIFNPALKHIAVDKFKFEEDKFRKTTYVLNLD